VRLDYLTIFPDYLAPLHLSLPGKAVERGLLEVHVHDLRRWTHDRHRTVDDTPYGGGAGMVMKPEPFGEAFAELGVDEGTTVVFTTPSGEPFTQALAAELSTRGRIVFACGRYEGIDQRVIDHAAGIAEVREISLGDYVLNGGEVAALAITEAVVRLLPGFMGNAESLTEESHAEGSGGLLEYPVYTKPAVWEGREVPAVLRSGDHGAIAAWRHEEARRRTAERRPDLLAPSSIADGSPIEQAVPGDAPELLVLQRACWVQEAVSNPDLAVVEIPALVETLEEMTERIRDPEVHLAVVRRGGRMIGSVSGRLEDDVWWISRLMVAPDAQGGGVGRSLLEHVLAAAPAAATSYALYTGAGSERNLRFYKKAGFRLRPDLVGPRGTVTLSRRRR